MTVRDTDQAARIAAVLETRRREAKARERTYRGGWTEANKAYERGRTDAFAEAIRLIDTGSY